MNIGIDIGSRFVKFAVDDSKKIKLYKDNSLDFYKNLDYYKDTFKNDRIVTTGYGRHKLQVLSGKVIPELQAHALGAIKMLNLENFCLLDIGGQDTKVLLVKKGKLIDFRTNDKCAASSGRFLENMARILDIDITEIMESFEEPIEISSTCAIFSESEIIAAITNGVPIKRIAAGINYALFLRIKPWLKELKEKNIVLSGGIAKSPALMYFIKKEFKDTTIIVPEEPIYTGALGCLYYMEESDE